MKNSLCPCGTGKDYSTCCGRFLAGKATPSSPEELMRSRYTAFTRVDVDYLANTMLSPAADGFDKQSVRDAAKTLQWTGLKVVHASQTLTQGIVEFYAYYTCDHKKDVLHEISEFRFDKGKWYYTNALPSH